MLPKEIKKYQIKSSHDYKNDLKHIKEAPMHFFTKTQLI
jgi:hypothetical protein